MSDTNTAAPTARTALHQLHLELGAKMVPFAGYDMPLQYPSGILKEHNHTRSQAGLFDVSHMGQLRLSGPDAAAALESLVPVDIVDLPLNTQRYALFTNPEGGILDDLMVANGGDHLFLVVNAACKQQDTAHLRQHLAGKCQIEELTDRSLLALQGPAAAAVMARLAPSTAKMIFMQTAKVTLAGAECFISRSGYTGEDGFEISVPNEQAEALARLLLAQPEVAPIGLGARDSLRLEAGLCLYGHDMDTTTTPIEASLGWALSKARRSGGARAGGYPGAEVIQGQLDQGVGRKRVGLLLKDRMPAREGAELVDANGKVIGRITSGGFGPTVGAPVAMGYVDGAHAQIGTSLHAIVRGKPVPVEVVKMPFTPARYFRG
ncbi:glycine cleavage system T protein [Collimonas arenae]|uniref:aminomethyltransferase n=1 Tax=Collimonas arenae TaxID=279058 RepID=A0A127PR63_9BURK|nr:glycine cleavage system aminomethyltransferase GcvT [Collimonas arenae]AMP00273.1 glycine cleavage system T protein [Collimonas arenae]AMP10149.1 glycine cleavage system T protein [Collimonas arenae]